MDIKINYLEEDSIVLVKVTGIMDFEKHKTYAKEILSFAKEHNSHKIFVNMLDMIPRVTTLEIEDFPKTLIECGAKPEHRIAILHNPPPPYDRGFSHFINVAFLKSLKIKPFTNKDMAHAWLKSEP
ncbi:MAG: hypothetical protein WC476_02020 [Phycisphaerae bacterium]|jgi:hypothetical protein